MNQPDALKALLEFRDERDWAQFHSPKDLAAALSIEASELLEVLLWKDPSEADPDRIREELADVFSYALLLAHHYDLDLDVIIREKIDLNRTRYPVDQARGSAAKHDEL